VRTVTLIASATEIVCALGFRKHLVGRSHECDYPPSVVRLPVCSQPKINIHTSASQIDKQVKAVLQNALSVYQVDTEKLKALKPDVIITQDHCEVCAVSLKDVKQAVCNWLNVCPKIISLHPQKLEDLWKGIQQVAQALGQPRRGEVLIKKLKLRLKNIQQKVRSSWPKPTVACIEWFQPLMAAGNWVPEMVEMLGAKNLFGKAGKHSPWMSWEQLQQKDPDIIILMPCGWDIKRSRHEISVLTQRRGWRNLKAVRQNQVYLADGNQYFNRPGPRLVESFEILAEIFYPQHFPPCHKGSGWQKLR